MTLYESVVNLHCHTPYSDGTLYHADIARAALAAGLDMVGVTDHNVWVGGVEGYYPRGALDGHTALLTVGEELHDQTRQPQKNHLLAYNVNAELAPHTACPQRLIDTARAAGGLTFLAHPCDAPGRALPTEHPLDWVNWEVTGYTGLEIWNYMTDFARHLHSPASLRYVFNPELVVDGPAPATLRRWDALTTAGQRVVGIGNADAHGTEYQLGRIRRVVFPYDFLFRQVNTHILTPEPLSRADFAADKARLFHALSHGHCFVGYDGLASARGFRFSAATEQGPANMGDAALNRTGVTLQILSPRPARLRLLANGSEVGVWQDKENAAYTVPAGAAGVFRAEAHLHFKGRWRGWIYSNPIYIQAP